MKQMSALMNAELIFLRRHGFLMVALVVALAWLVIISLTNAAYQHVVLGMVLSLDVSAIALLCGAGMYMLEARQGVLAAFAATPVVITRKLACRVLIVAFLSSMTGLLICLPFTSYSEWGLLAVMCLISSVFYTIAGILIIVNDPSISGMVVRLGLVSPFWLAPYLSFFDLYHHTVFWLLPSYGVIMMFKSSIDGFAIHFEYLFHSLIWIFFLDTWLWLSYSKRLSDV